MKILIVFIIAFLALVYTYTFLKIRKNRMNQKTAVDEFNDAYLKKKNNKLVDTAPVVNSNYRKYITKYNSKTDYISKDEL